MLVIENKRFRSLTLTKLIIKWNGYEAQQTSLLYVCVSFLKLGRA